jgi:hypothetical protein
MKRGVEKEDNKMPSLSEVVYQVQVQEGVSRNAKGQKIKGFTKGQEIEGFVEWKKMLLISGEESSKVETSFSFFLKCKDDCRIDLLVHNGHVIHYQNLVDDANVKFLE